MSEPTDVAKLRQQLRQEQEARQHVEEEAKRMKEEAKRMKEEAKRMKEEAKRMKVKLQQSENERQLAENERDQEKKKTQPLTLDEFLEASHNLVYMNLSVETDSFKTTTGTLTAHGKAVPARLRPWPDFLQEQKNMLSTLFASFPLDMRLFDNRNYLSILGSKVSKAPIANEKMLENFLHNCVEDPVRCIVHELSQLESLRQSLDIGFGINFENHIKAIDDTAYQVPEQQRQQFPAPRPLQEELEEAEVQPPRTPNHETDPPKLNPDQICVYRYDEQGREKRSVIAVAEYKAPHKLTPLQLRAGLHELPKMDIFEDVVCKNKIPTDPDAKFQHYAEELTAAAITQTYNYMIKSGLRYSLLTTGETIVFLNIDWHTPEVLYFHLAEPGPEMEAHEGQFRSCTAVAQYLAFHLLALSNREHINQDRRSNAFAALKKWKMDFRHTASTVSPDAKTPSSESSRHLPNVYGNVDRSIKKRKGGPGQSGNILPVRRRRRKDDDSDEDWLPRPPRPAGPPGPPDTPSPAERGRPAEQGQSEERRSDRIRDMRAGGENDGHDGHDEHDTHNDQNDYDNRNNHNNTQPQPQDSEYCTQKCLLGLVRGDTLDLNCPNLALHCQSDGNSSQGNRHPISHDEFQQLLAVQLQETLDTGITPLDIEGARGVLFQVSLLAHGYTFIGKGTTAIYIPFQKYEQRVYKRLEPLQGVHVPVLLGAIDLRSLGRTYFYAVRVDIVYLIFMSWAGVHLRTVSRGQLGDGLSLEDSAVQAMKAVHQEGVVHTDARMENMLFSPHTHRVMVIDFERASILPKHHGQFLATKKRQRADGIATKAVKVKYHPNRFIDDIISVKGVFL